jgi:hypothetical protein
LATATMTVIAVTKTTTTTTVIAADDNDGGSVDGDGEGQRRWRQRRQRQRWRRRQHQQQCIYWWVRFRIGLWSAAAEEESSNFKELKNLVDTVDEEAKAGRLQNCEFFLFTDNSTAESCFYRGSSKSRHLHALACAPNTRDGTRDDNPCHSRVGQENDSSRHGWVL